MKSQLNILTREEISEITDASMRVLSETGLKVASDEALDLLAKIGAKIDTKSNIARIPAQVVEGAIGTAPKRMTLHSRDGKRDVKLYDRERPALTTDGIGVKLLDRENKTHRRSTSRDLFRLALISDYLREVDIFWPMVVAGDVPESEHTVKEFAISILGTSKHIQHEANGKLEARSEIAIAQTIAGGKEELRKRPLFSAVQCPVSPLKLEKGSVEAAIEFSRAGVPVAGMSMTQMGATAPATISATLVLANAEILGSLVLSQAASEGSPFIFAISSAPVDIRSNGGFLAGSPELALISAAEAQIARSYGLPSLVAGMTTDARYQSQQASFEKLQTGLLPALAGATIISGIGGFDTDNVISMEQMIIDSDIWSSILRMIGGIEVNQKNIHLETIEKNGSDANYSDDIDTLKTFNKEVWSPRLPIRQSHPSWKASGGKTIEDMAGEIVKTVLENHRAPALDRDIERDIMVAYKKYQKELQGERL